MSESAWLIIAVVLLALAFDFPNGWNDAANAIATVVSTRVLTPAQAVFLAGVLNVAGAFYSTAVAKTIGGGIVHPKAVTQLTVAAAVVSGTCWNTWMTPIGIPGSASHPLIGGVRGAGLAHGGAAALSARALKPSFAAMAALSWTFFQANPRVGQPPRGPAVRLLQDSCIRWVESC